MPNSTTVLPDDLRKFIDSEQWTFARTMPEWPHEYIVREKVDEDLFVQLVQHIREHGYEGKFYRESFIFYEIDGIVYWTMGAPLPETIIVNRCKTENTYDNRLLHGKLPEAKGMRSE